MWSIAAVSDPECGWVSPSSWVDLGTRQAGVSYQLLSYPLKCEGWEYCRLTDGLEVGYSLTQAFSVSAMLTAVAFACTNGRVRMGLIVYSALNAAVYIVV